MRADDVGGRVFEVTSTGRTPSADAFVIVHWTGSRPGFGHYESVCIQAAIGRTDAQGRFAIAEPPPLRSTFLVFRDDPAVAVWKPGYDEQSRKAGEWTLVPTRMMPEQRTGLTDVLRGYGCPDDKGGFVLADPQVVLAEFRRALEAEQPAQREGWEVCILQRGGPNPANR